MINKIIIGIIVSAFISSNVQAQKDLTAEVQETINKSKNTRQAIQDSYSPRDPASLERWKNSKEMLTEFDELLNSNEERDWFNEVEEITKE